MLNQTEVNTELNIGPLCSCVSVDIELGPWISHPLLPGPASRDFAGAGLKTSYCEGVLILGAQSS
jgi:hypothetical protein